MPHEIATVYMASSLVPLTLSRRVRDESCVRGFTFGQR
jgi:hypothetical protein